MKKLITIIVPTYNMETYLRKGLDSLLIAKSLHLVEVIVVNDGSKDQSLDIAREYERKYPDVFVVIDKPNGNYGSCINVGLQKATGKYVKIMDADDSFLTSHFETLVNVLSAVDADLVFTDYIKYYTSGKTVKYTFDLPVRQTAPIEDVYNTQAFYNIQMHALTYRTDILKRMNYRQTEGISYTDTEWCFSPVTQVKTVYYLNVCVYRYLMGREGQTIASDVMSKTMPQRLKCFSALLRSIHGLQLSPQMKIFTSEQLAKHAFYMYEFYLIKHPQIDRTELIAFDSELKAFNPSAYKRCNDFQYRLHIPYHHITDWRERGTKKIPLFIRILGKILDIAGNIRTRFFMQSNPNEPK